MLASGITGITLRDVRLGQIAIGLLLLQPLVGYVLTIVGLMPAAVGIVPFNPLPLAVLALSLGLLIYFSLHVRRGWLFRLFPNWASHWPHKWIVLRCSVGFVSWL